MNQKSNLRDLQGKSIYSTSLEALGPDKDQISKVFQRTHKTIVYIKYFAYSTNNKTLSHQRRVVKTNIDVS